MAFIQRDEYGRIQIMMDSPFKNSEEISDSDSELQYFLKKGIQPLKKNLRAEVTAEYIEKQNILLRGIQIAAAKELDANQMRTALKKLDAQYIAQITEINSREGF